MPHIYLAFNMKRTNKQQESLPFIKIYLKKVLKKLRAQKYEKYSKIEKKINMYLQKS